MASRTSCCSYPNGTSCWTIATAQLCLLLGLLLFVGALLDCQIVTIPSSEGINGTIFEATANATAHQKAATEAPTFALDETTNSSNTTNSTITGANTTRMNKPSRLYYNNNTDLGLGVFFWEWGDGTCYGYWTDERHESNGNPNPENSGDDDGNGEGNYIEDLFSEYLHGDDAAFDEVRGMAVVGVLLSLILFAFLLSFSCVLYNNVVKNVLAILILLMLPSFKAVAFVVKTSSFCRQFDCSFGRSAYLSYSAVAFDTLAGVLLIFTQPPNPQTKIDRQFQLQQQERMNQLQLRNRDNIIHGDIRTLTEEERQRDGFNNAREIPVESDFIDPSLINANAVAPAVGVAGGESLEEEVAAVAVATSLSAHSTDTTNENFPVQTPYADERQEEEVTQQETHESTQQEVQEHSPHPQKAQEQSPHQSVH